LHTKSNIDSAVHSCLYSFSEAQRLQTLLQTLDHVFLGEV